jgi:hypothetical protein
MAPGELGDRTGRPNGGPPSSYCYYYCIIAYRILLTIFLLLLHLRKGVFSKLKLLKTYLRSTVTQERLNGLVTIAIENDIMEINYEDIIEDFISKNTRRMLLFSRT